MDSNRFDDLTRSVAIARSRRTVLRATAGAVVAAFVGRASSQTALADVCKRDGKLCKKDSQCCSGLCVQGPDGTSAVPTTVCCTPEDPAITCAQGCGQQINNCGQTIECGTCPREACAGPGECASGSTCLTDICCPDADACFGEFCCPADRSETSACCPTTGQCCECFQNNAPGAVSPFYCGCDSPRELCGTYPDDECCLMQDTCVNGACIPKEYACPPQSNPLGDRVNCSSGCCNGLCCPPERPECDGAGNCVAELAVCQSQSDCVTGICSAFDESPGICCPVERLAELEVPDGNGGMMTVTFCCSRGTEARGCPDVCTPIHYAPCAATFRGSQPRVT